MQGGAENRQGMDFATFRRVLGGKQQVVGAANEATIAYLTSAKATFEEKARFVFDASDWVVVEELDLCYYIGKPYYLRYIPILVT